MLPTSKLLVSVFQKMDRWKRTLPSATRPLALRRALRESRIAILFGRARDSSFLSILLAIIFLLLTFSIIDRQYQLETSMAFSNRDSRTTADLSSAKHSTGNLRDLSILLQRITHSSFPTTSSKLVVIIAVNNAYRGLALNFVCNLRRLNIPNYLILAMDRPVYDFLVASHTNVFLYHSQRSQSVPFHLENNSISGEAVFGSSLFVETSKRKSMLVLKVLRLGFNVLFSDADVVFVENPIPLVKQYESDIVIQSDRSHSKEDAPLNYNINSGFYLARATARTVTALQAIIKYTHAIRRSEQKGFNYVLCGAFKDHHAGPGLRVGTKQCIHTHSGATATVLPLDAFPNGSDNSLWTNATKSFAEDYPHIIAIHANYVKGRSEKIERLRRIGYWFLTKNHKGETLCALRT